MRQGQIYLISGRSGVGKTTFIRKVAESVGFNKCAGFYTTEIREKQTRVGFEWRTFQGESGILANLKSGQPRVGKYHVVLDSFEEMLERLGEVSTNKILLVDEVGKMECLSARFRGLLGQWEEWDAFRIFTVPEQGTPFIESFKARHKNKILELTFTNRTEIRNQLVHEIEQQL